MANNLWPFRDEFGDLHTARRNGPPTFFWLSNKFHQLKKDDHPYPLTFSGTTTVLRRLHNVRSEPPSEVSRHPYLNEEFVCWLQVPQDVTGKRWYFGTVSFPRWRNQKNELYEEFLAVAAKAGAMLRQIPCFRKWLWPCMSYLVQADRLNVLRVHEDVAWWMAMLFTKPEVGRLIHSACVRTESKDYVEFTIDNPALWSKTAISSWELNSAEPIWPGRRVVRPFREIPCPAFVEHQIETDSDTGRSPKSQQPATEANASDNRNATVATQHKTLRRTTNKRGRRGRPKVDEAEAKNRRERVANWKRWKAAGHKVRNPMQRYCTDETAVGRAIDPPTLKRYVNWVTVNRTRKAQKRG